MRIIKGTVQGYAARKYPDFLYRKPKETTVDSSLLFQDRVYPDKEFPKWSGKPGVQCIEYTELADYEVRIEEVTLGVLNVEVFMMPNYLCPLLKSAKKVYDIKAQYWMVLAERLEQMSFYMRVDGSKMIPKVGFDVQASCGMFVPGLT